ncbi:DUF1345 domain-containing protein [Pedococcus sp. NPDC057267]|uniref:DUF1345 domain-containing protein n=1 Tax=Pedococcus sp. NPDC057267 TaxID=3346077 RepID=UPI00362D6518
MNLLHRSTNPHSPHGKGPSATAAVATAATAGAVVAVGASLAWHWQLGALLGFMAAAAVFLTRLWWAIWPMDQHATREHARREDPRQSLSDTTMLTAALFSLAAVALLLTGSTGTKDEQAAVSVLGVALAWALVHSVFTTRYARTYYENHQDGLDFNDDTQPRYRDFAYLAFTVGMTFQVSDTLVRSWTMRRNVLRQALVSYLFGAVIIATMINLIGGLGSSGGQS